MRQRAGQPRERCLVIKGRGEKGVDLALLVEAGPPSMQAKAWLGKAAWRACVA